MSSCSVFLFGRITFKWQFVSAILALGICCSGFGAPVTTFGEGQPQSSELLEKGKPINREISPGEEHDYRLTLLARQFAHLTVEQNGIDVTVQLFGSENTLLAEFDDEVAMKGEESVSFVSEASGEFVLKIKPKLKGVPAGFYEIRLTEQRPATEADRSLFESHKLRTQSSRLMLSGKYSEALSLSERALEISRQAPEADPVYLSLLTREVAAILYSKGLAGKAQPLFEQALAGIQKQLGPDHPQAAFTESQLGSVYHAIGEEDKADQSIRHALSIEEKTLGREHPWVASALKSLGVWAMDRGDSAKAEQYYLRALSIVEKTMSPDTLLYGQLQNNLGVLYIGEHEYSKAKPYLERALAVEEKLFGPEGFLIANVLQNLGNIAYEEKDFTLAEQDYRRALFIREKVIGPEHPDVAANLINIANIYHARGDDAKSLEIHLEAFRIAEKTAGPYQGVTIMTLVNVARTYAALGDLPNAILAQSRLDAAMEQTLEANLKIGSEQEKLDFLDDILQRTNRTVSLNLQLAPDDPDASSLAALVLLQRKGRVLDAMADSMGSLQRRSDPEGKALLEKFKEANEQLAQFALDGPRKMPQKDFQNHLKELDDRKDELEQEISRKNAEFRAESQIVTLQAVQASIPDNAALLEFIGYSPFDPKSVIADAADGSPRIAAYVIRRAGAPQGRDLGDAKAIQEALKRFRDGLRDPLRNDFRESSRALDEKIMKPIRPLLGNATRLLISPDGDLNLIPFEALMDEKGRYLVVDYSISYLTTGRDLLRMQVLRSSKTSPVVVANPIFGEPGATQIASTAQAKPRNLSSSSIRRSVTTGDNLSSVYFAPLAGTEQEAQSIHALFPDAVILAGQKATKSAVIAVQAPSILHIATHGFFLQDAATDPGEGSKSGTPAKSNRAINESTKIENPLLRSGLALSGANINKEGTNSGILTALESSNLNLWGTKLVVLSACDTGLGDVRSGEGVYGLRRAFILAGTESLVMSLWPVSDRVTRDLMTEYYAGLKKGLGRGEALRQSQLSIMNRKGQHHPFYWASFIQAGEWANLNGER